MVLKSASFLNLFFLIIPICLRSTVWEVPIIFLCHSQTSLVCFLYVLYHRHNFSLHECLQVASLPFRKLGQCGCLLSHAWVLAQLTNGEMNEWIIDIRNSCIFHADSAGTFTKQSFSLDFISSVIQSGF